MAVQRGCEGIEPAGYSRSGKATRDGGPSGGRLGSTPWWPNRCSSSGCAAPTGRALHLRCRLSLIHNHYTAGERQHWAYD
jgi:hypothetical protein